MTALRTSLADDLAAVMADAAATADTAERSGTGPSPTDLQDLARDLARLDDLRYRLMKARVSGVQRMLRDGQSLKTCAEYASLSQKQIVRIRDDAGIEPRPPGRPSRM